MERMNPDGSSNSDFKINLFLVVISFVVWVRFLLMLQLTKVFGPMLRIIIVMIGEVFKFLFIWIIILLTLTSISQLLFGELEAYQDYFTVSLTTFGTALANYDFSDFDDLDLGPMVGKIFVVFSLIINAVVLLNFIIAILADTYSNLMSNKLGLYYDVVISKINIYEDDEFYGGLVVGIPPFNVLAILMAPVYWYVSDQKLLKKINDTFTKVIFAPVALSFTALFMAMNLILLPFAYLAAILKKAKLVNMKLPGKNKTGDRVRDLRSDQPSLDLLTFIFLGLPLLILGQVKDAYIFLSLWYRDDVKEFGLEAVKETFLTEEQFECLE